MNEISPLVDVSTREATPEEEERALSQVKLTLEQRVERLEEEMEQKELGLCAHDGAINALLKWVTLLRKQTGLD